MLDYGSMRKTVFDIDHLIFVGKVCLVAAVLLGVILVLRSSIRSGVVIASEQTETTALAKSTAVPIQTPPSSLHPPRLSPKCVTQIELEFARGHQPVKANGFIVVMAESRYLVTHASILTRNAWEQVTQVTLMSEPILLLKAKPTYIGPYTEDNQPNMLNRPDLGLDCVFWSMPGSTQTVEGLSLSLETISVGAPVWIVGTSAKLYRCKVIEITENALSIQPIDRFSLDDNLGMPVVNTTGQVVGTVLGGNDLCLSGASATALRRRLISTQTK